MLLSHSSQQSLFCFPLMELLLLLPGCCLLPACNHIFVCSIPLWMWSFLFTTWTCRKIREKSVNLRLFFSSVSSCLSDLCSSINMRCVLVNSKEKLAKAKFLVRRMYNIQFFYLMCFLVYLFICLFVAAAAAAAVVVLLCVCCHFPFVRLF